MGSTMIFALAKIMEMFDYSVGARPISSTHRLVVIVGRPVNKYQGPRPLYHTSSGYNVCMGYSEA